MATYAFTRPLTYTGAQIEIDRQQQAARAIAGQFGLVIDSAQGGGYVTVQAHTDATGMLADLVVRLGVGDTLVVADIGALGPTPSAIIATASELVAKGVRLLVAELGGELNLPTLRTYAKAFQPLEIELVKARTDLAKERAEHARELDDTMREYDRAVVETLMQRGISISMLAGGKSAADIKRPSRGVELRELRQALGMTQEEAGKLLTPALSKPTVSRMETEGRGERFEVLMGVLKGTLLKRQRADRQAMTNNKAAEAPVLAVAT